MLGIVEVPDQLLIAWAHGPAFLDAYDPAGLGRYTVAMPGAAAIMRGTPLGQRVQVVLDFLDTRRTFRHVARVVAHAPGPPEIVTFEFLDGAQKVRELIVCHAEGDSVPYLNRRAERRPVWLPVMVEVDDGWRHGVATELSEVGAFIMLKRPPLPGTDITIRIRTEDGERLDVRARVMRAEPLGATPGIAVDLVFAGRADEVWLRTALRAALQPVNR
jgi:hypothetical protein